MISIRRATASDWKAYRDLRLRALTQAPDAYGTTLDEEDSQPDEWWRERVVGALSLIASHDELPVATAVGIPDPHEEGAQEIVAVWVEPSARGQGVARQLVMALVDDARAHSAPAISLWVSDGNEAARRVYELCGFRLTGERDVVRGSLYESRMRRSTESLELRTQQP